MRARRATAGPFAERPYFSTEEFERIASDELQRVALLPSDPAAIRIDRFIEKRFDVVPEYEDLGPGLLGVTVFNSKGVYRVVISSALDVDADPVQERRARTTLAHEAGHCLLHAYLFVLEGQSKPLFGDFSNAKAPRVLCKEEHVCKPGEERGYDGRWWEYQANKMMAALLMPRDLVLKVAEPFCSASGHFGRRRLEAARRRAAEQAVADTFNVNPQAARLRLDNLFPAAEEAQLTL